MKLTDFELLQPVQYHHTTGYISFMSEYYISICFKDIPLPESENSRWGRHYANIIVYPEYWHEIRSRVDEEQEERTSETTSYFLQSRGCDYVGAAH